MDEKLTAKLREYADIVLKYVKTELTHDGNVDPAVWVPLNGELQRLDLGFYKKLVDSPNGKAILFKAIKGMLRDKKLDTVVWVSEAWVGESTPKALAMGHEEFLRRADKAKRGLTDLVDEGLVTRMEVIMITIQTPTGSLLARVPFERDMEKRSVRFGDVEIQSGPGKLEGRIAMFNDDQKTV